MKKYDPKPIPKLTEADISKFWCLVDIKGPNECWEWERKNNRKDGYGEFWLDGRGPYVKAHRISYLLHYKVDPSPLDVLHTCDNPSCVNPKHLMKGTHPENMRQAKELHRFPSGDQHHYRKHPDQILRGEKNGRAKFTESDIREIKQYHRDHPEESQRSIARRFGIRHSHLSDIVTGKFWSHVMLDV